MAEQVTRYRAVDGTLLLSMSQCLAYELKRQVSIFGDNMKLIKFSDTGVINVEDVCKLAADMNAQIAMIEGALSKAITDEAEAAAKGGA